MSLLASTAGRGVSERALAVRHELLGRDDRPNHWATVDERDAHSQDHFGKGSN